MLFLLSLVGDGGAGFPICEQNRNPIYRQPSSVLSLCPVVATRNGLSEQNQAITLSLLRAMREDHLEEFTPPTEGQLSVTISRRAQYVNKRSN